MWPGVLKPPRLQDIDLQEVAVAQSPPPDDDRRRPPTADEIRRANDRIWARRGEGEFDPTEFKHLRVLAGRSQEEAAEALRCDRSMVSFWERGQKVPVKYAKAVQDWMADVRRRLDDQTGKRR